MATDFEGRSRRRRVATLLVIALFSPAARAEALRGSVSAGLGAGYSLLGVKLELGAGLWSGFAAISPLAVYSNSSIMGALGARWSAQPDGSGLGFALQGWLWKLTDYDRDTQVVIAATIHWRWRFGHFLIDAGAGPAVRLDRYRPGPDPEYKRGLVSANCIGIGLFVDRGRCGGIPFDVELGFGFAF